MKKIIRKVFPMLCLAAAFVLFPANVQAKNSETIKPGVYAGDIPLADMTLEEANAAVEEYIVSLETVEVTLLAADNQSVVVSAGELGVAWANPEVLEDALNHGTQGNIVQRYKALKDLENNNVVYPIELEFDITAIDRILTEQCKVFDREAIDYELIREDGEFTVIEGQIGYLLDVETSIDTVYGYLADEWNHEAATIQLDIAVSEPRGSVEELSMVKDVLGTYTTSYSTSGSNRSANVENGCRLIDGTLLYPGDEFSTYTAVAPFSEANGYYMAGSYLSGRVVDSLGGGICQVSTTLYNAVLLSELEVTERYNHSMIVNYVDPSADAAIAESSGKDFKFVNNLDYPIYIEGYTQGKKITFNIYGVETRPENRTVEYVSEILETTQPTAEVIYPDAGFNVGYVSISSAHTGYKARLWKIVKEDGVEVSREVVNSSTYKMTPRTAVVGVATADPNVYNEIMAAIATNDINHVRNIAALLTMPPAPEQTPEAAPAQ
ncbi:MAG: VanW family protein [Lachnospiraceae bacterium]|nr:VanW family protein [Lachnospiraceae bacterium]MBQ7781059.1 VanW family protein [Lachnospiraceae bacterium]